MARSTRLKKGYVKQLGLGLVETLVSVAILGTSVVAFVVALSTGSIAVGHQEREVTAQGLAQSQMESTKSYPFDPGAVTYPAITAPAGYSIDVRVAPVPDADADIQKITVTISQEEQALLSVADYKMNR